MTEGSRLILSSCTLTEYSSRVETTVLMLLVDGVYGVQDKEVDRVGWVLDTNPKLL